MERDMHKGELPKKACECTQPIWGKGMLFTQRVLMEKQVSTRNLSIFLATFNTFLEGGQFKKRQLALPGEGNVFHCTTDFTTNSRKHAATSSSGNPFNSALPESKIQPHEFLLKHELMEQEIYL